MKETKDVTSAGGAPLTLLGEPCVVGQKAINFTAVDIKGKDVSLFDFKGKIIVLSIFPSVDTSVCAKQTLRFNVEASKLGDQVIILTLSKDLPFALGRFCGAEDIHNLITLSDYKESEFGLKYGYLIKENKLLCRGVVVIDDAMQVRYVEYLDDIFKEPAYEKALEVIRELI